MARTFADSTGITWEVVEVHRSSSKPGAVSSGFELGWLSFTSANAKRRLAPIPQWESSPDGELERLCSTARTVPMTAPHPFEPGSSDRRRKDGEPAQRPDTGERRRAADRSGSQTQRAPAELTSGLTQGPDTGVEATVRRFAHDARARGQPAIDAMVQLKGMLLEQFGEQHAELRDIKSIRRWFV
ncbi:MAG: hypothetical protein ACJ8AD_12265, partial [Gemmatimonadaceae bacterium]